MKLFKCSALLAAAALLASCSNPKGVAADNGATLIDQYVNEFNSHDEELYVQKYSNADASAFMKENVPVFECPDKELEKTYYFRWWTYRKQIKETPVGLIVTEFLPEVGWAGKYNAINCPAAHQIAEGRWLRNSPVINDYIRFWCSADGTPRSYSFPISDAVLKYYSVNSDIQLVKDVYDKLKGIYAAWEADHRGEYGLFWQMDDRDGMEVSISGSLSPDCTGYRPTINSYMYADAKALSTMADMIGNADDAALYAAKADTIKTLMDTYLWDKDARFYKVIPRHRDFSLSPAREEIGYVPWMYDIPDADKSDAWLQLTDTLGFKAPFGPTTAEQRAEGFKISYVGHGCQWNGPSWPFATAQTLTGLAACLHRLGEGSAVTKDMYFETLQTYSNSHRNELSDGTKVCWIDENLNPYTGQWLARNILSLPKDHKYYERGKDYNHSSFCDLIINGLVGVQPQPDGKIVIEPLIPEGIWDYFYLSGIKCAGNDLTILYDKSGDRYNLGKGFVVYIDGKKAYESESYNTKLNL